MAIPREDSRSAEHIAPLRNEKMKTFCVRDGSQRVLILYEAVQHVQDGEPCLATIYMYDTTNNFPTATREKDATWNSDWDFDILVNGEV